MEKMKDKMDKEKKETDAELLEEAEKLYTELISELPTEVRYKPPTEPEEIRMPFKVRLIKESLLYRIADITESTIDLAKKKKVVPSYIMARCTFETAALLFLVHQRLEKAVDTQRLEDINEFLNKVSVGGRIESMPKAPNGTRIESINILTAIDKLDKEHKNLKKLYDFLSEFAHPNSSGALLSYAKLNLDDDLYTLSFDKPYQTSDEPLSGGLIVLTIAITVFSHYYKKIGELLPQYTEICGGIDDN